MIKICKILKQIYNADDYYIFSGWCGEKITLIYSGDNPPQPLKTVDYKLIGEFEKHEHYGKQFIISEYEKVGKINIHKQTETQRVQKQTISDWLEEYNKHD